MLENHETKNLLMLAQALEDLIDHEMGVALDEDVLWTAELYVAKHPKLFLRVLRKENLEAWKELLQDAKAQVLAQGVGHG